MINTNSGRNSPFSNQENTIGALYNNLKNNSNTHTITMNTLHISDSSTNWEDLRRQARHIEQDLDVKLVSFSKLGSSSTSGGSSNLDRFGDGRHRSHHSTLDFDNEDAMSHVSGKNNDQTSNDDMFRTMAMEINSLLQNLENINNSLLDFSNQGNNNSNVSMLHSLQRHRDILQDFQSEFNKIKSNIENKRQREDLLGSVRRDIDMHYRQQKQMNNRGMNDSSAATDAFLGERQRLLNSDKLTQEAIQMGLNTRESLREQRAQFAALQGRLGGLMQKFPMINSLVHRINWRKKRDSLILAGVIAVCVFILLLYVMRS